MNTLIVYATKYGCTENCVKDLAKKLTGKVVYFNLKSGNAPDLSQYDKIIVGGSIYIGRIQKEVSDFCSKNLDGLKTKKTGFFICCMRDGAIAESELNDAFPKELLAAAAAKDCFGGEFIFSKMNFLDKLIVKKVSKINKDTSNILTENINSFASIMNKA